MLTPITELERIIDRFAVFKVPLQVTEFDITTARVANGQPLDEAAVEQLKVDYTRDLMTLWFSHPATVAFIMWGFWDGRHWKDSAPIFRTDWSLKPSGQAYKDLVLRGWWTKPNGTTDANGSYRVPGFPRHHQITVTAPTSPSKQVTARLIRGDATVDVVLE